MEKKRMKRRPNKGGSIVFLGNGRRNPYAARAPVTAYNEKGYPIYEVIGYYRTRQEAEAALYDYLSDPYDLDANKMRFSDIYDILVEKKEASPGNFSARYVLQAAYKRSEALHNRYFATISTLELQRLLDDMTEELSRQSLIQTRNLWTQMWEMAVEYDLVRKNRAKYVEVRKEDDSQSNIAFTMEEMKKIKAAAATDDGAAAILIMCLSGFRVAAFEKLKVDLEAMTFTGGVKTKASKDRVVPIHSCIKELTQRLLDHGFLFGEKPRRMRDRFEDILTRAGVDPGKGNTRHTPHDCRGTCATLLDAAGVPEMHIKLILGHSLSGNITQAVYIHKTVEELRESLEKIIIEPAEDESEKKRPSKKAAPKRTN